MIRSSILFMGLLVLVSCKPRPLSISDGLCVESKYALQSLDLDCPCGDVSVSVADSVQVIRCRADQRLETDQLYVTNPDEPAVVTMSCICEPKSE